MTPLPHRELHEGLGASFTQVNDAEVVDHYGNLANEFLHLTQSAGILDFSFRGRICVLGEDRAKYLHGQLTNDINRLQPGQGCYSALCNQKGRFEADLNVHCLENEILLDFEPGLSELVAERLERNIVADDVELADVAPHFGLLSVQGPKSADVVADLEAHCPTEDYAVTWSEHETLGQIYVARNSRLGSNGFDVYASENSIPAIADKLIAAAHNHGGGTAGWSAFETARIAAGIPRFGQDMTDANLVPEAGIAESAVSYKKGCYIGQEILNRLRTFAEVSRTLRRLQFADGAAAPEVGASLELAGKSVGKVTSVALPPGASRPVAMGYIHKSANEAGTELNVAGQTVTVANLPA